MNHQVFARQKNVIQKGNVTFMDTGVFVCIGPFVFCNYHTLVTLLILAGRSFSPIEFLFFKGTHKVYPLLIWLLQILKKNPYIILI